MKGKDKHGSNTMAQLYMNIKLQSITSDSSIEIKKNKLDIYLVDDLGATIQFLSMIVFSWR